jgi:hypothetical protein
MWTSNSSEVLSVNLEKNTVQKAFDRATYSLFGNKDQDFSNNEVITQDINWWFLHPFFPLAHDKFHFLYPEGLIPNLTMGHVSFIVMGEERATI